MLLAGRYVIASPKTPYATYHAGTENLDSVEYHLAPVVWLMDGGARIYVGNKCEANGFPLFPKIQTHSVANENAGLSAVRGVFSKDKRVRVDQGPDKMIRVRIGGNLSPLLQTKIRYLRFEKLDRYNELLAEPKLENSPEIKAALKALKFDTEPGWVTVASIIVQAPMEGVPRLPASLSNVTLDQALDLIARTFKVIVVYEECMSPNGTRRYDIRLEGLYSKWMTDRQARWNKLMELGRATGICPIHHLRLKEADLHCWSGSLSREPRDPRPRVAHFEREEKYPLSLPYLCRRYPTPGFNEVSHLSYCSACQHLFEEATGQVVPDATPASR